MVLHFTHAYQFYFTDNLTSCDDEPGTADGSQTKISYEYILLLLGQLINGYTSAVLFVLGITYIDQSVPADEAPLYVGEYCVMLSRQFLTKQHNRNHHPVT